jgi:hypothetical protein
MYRPSLYVGVTRCLLEPAISHHQLGSYKDVILLWMIGMFALVFCRVPGPCAWLDLKPKPGELGKVGNGICQLPVCQGMTSHLRLRRQGPEFHPRPTNSHHTPPTVTHVPLAIYPPLTPQFRPQRQRRCLRRCAFWLSSPPLSRRTHRHSITSPPRRSCSPPAEGRPVFPHRLFAHIPTAYTMESTTPTQQASGGVGASWGAFLKVCDPVPLSLQAEWLLAPALRCA